jgi:hypothetical protein
MAYRGIISWLRVARQYLRPTEPALLLGPFHAPVFHNLPRHFSKSRDFIRADGIDLPWMVSACVWYANPIFRHEIYPIRLYYTVKMKSILDHGSTDLDRATHSENTAG